MLASHRRTPLVVVVLVTALAVALPALAGPAYVHHDKAEGGKLDIRRPIFGYTRTIANIQVETYRPLKVRYLLGKKNLIVWALDTKEDSQIDYLVVLDNKHYGGWCTVYTWGGRYVSSGPAERITDTRIGCRSRKIHVKKRHVTWAAHSRYGFHIDHAPDRGRYKE